MGNIAFPLRSATAALLLLLLFTGCLGQDPRFPHTSLDPQASQLRAAFNADSGRVRVVALVSPT